MSDESAAIHRSLSASVVAVDWKEDLRALRASDSYHTANHSAKTLAKHPALTVVLVAMKSDGSMEEHHADSAITVHCLEGRFHFTVDGTAHELDPGQMLLVTERLPHSVQAVEECAFLLTIGEQHHTEASE
ncbi:MAG: cupin domain-containing protein [Candidatus Dormibacteria bacterium]